MSVGGLLREQIDLVAGVPSVPETKNGKPNSLPITPLTRERAEAPLRGPAAR